MSKKLEEGLNKDEIVFYGEAPHRPVRDGLRHIGGILYSIFVPGSLLREYKNSPHLHEDKSNLLWFRGGEIIRFGAEVVGVVGVTYHLFLKEIIKEYSQYYGYPFF